MALEQNKHPNPSDGVDKYFGHRDAAKPDSLQPYRLDTAAAGSKPRRALGDTIEIPSVWKNLETSMPGKESISLASSTKISADTPALKPDAGLTPPVLNDGRSVPTVGRQFTLDELAKIEMPEGMKLTNFKLDSLLPQPALAADKPTTQADAERRTAELAAQSLPAPDQLRTPEQVVKGLPAPDQPAAPEQRADATPKPGKDAKPDEAPLHDASAEATGDTRHRSTGHRHRHYHHEPHEGEHHRDHGEHRHHGRHHRRGGGHGRRRGGGRRRRQRRRHHEHDVPEESEKDPSMKSELPRKGRPDSGKEQDLAPLKPGAETPEKFGRTDREAPAGDGHALERMFQKMGRDIGKLAHKVANFLGTVGDCAKGPRLTFKELGLVLPPLMATEQGKLLEKSGLFEEVPRSQVREGDYGYRHWSPRVIKQHHGVDKGDSFIVSRVDKDGTLHGSNDHHFEVPEDGGRYRGMKFLRPTKAFWDKYGPQES